MSKEHYDFAGWATRCNIKCSDGRTIRPGAFSADDGKRVPLVWMHNHKDVNQVLGHADLEEKSNGDMYAYCSFNGTEAGQNAKECVEHGDVVALSIFANELRQKGGDVFHGAIKEVSVVLAGANRGAIIDNVLAHGELSDEEAEIQFVGYGDIMIHKDKDEENDEEEEKDNEEEQEEPEDEKTGSDESNDEESDDESGNDEEDDEDDDEKKPVKHADEEDSDEESVGDVLATLNEKQKKAVAIIISQISKGGNAGKNLSHSDAQNASEEELSDDEETVEDVYNTLTDKQKKVVAYIVDQATQQEEGGSEMKHNVFDGAGTQSATLSHDEFQEIFKVGQQMGSLKAAFQDAVEEGFIEHADGDYGITNLEYLFPEAKVINQTPEFIKRNTEWVDGVMSATHHTPFSRVKTIFADITEDAARAKGYIKGKYKKEEVFALLKRVTEPQTIYKKQKLDKDDIEDVRENMNIIPWMKSEMQLMLKEEIARAVLIGDGRLASDDDKIRENNIRPVYNDEDLFTIKYPVNVAANATETEIAEALIEAMLKSRKLYKGSGNPVFYTTDDYITDALLIKNGIKERIYKSEAEVATAMRVKNLVAVEVMEGQTIDIKEGNTTHTYPLIGVSVNLADYNIGTNGGAKTDFFDDFDIDFNQYKYLYETRMSGALVKPYSAISYYLVRA